MLELSVEFFPPKTGEGISRFKEAAKELSLMRFGFASVTYGAGGSTRDGTLATARELKKSCLDIHKITHIVYLHKIHIIIHVKKIFTHK